MTAIPGQNRPYPNVIPTPSGKWEARRPSNGKQHHLGTFATPEAAYAAVLNAQADHLETTAAEYRAKAGDLRGGAR